MKFGVVVDVDLARIPELSIICCAYLHAALERGRDQTEQAVDGPVVLEVLVGRRHFGRAAGGPCRTRVTAPSFTVTIVSGGDSRWHSQYLW